MVTGATGKVGRVFIKKFLKDPRYDQFVVRAFCHRQRVETHKRLEAVYGSIDQSKDVRKAVKGVTHVLHLATSKEDPDTIMDVSIKGLFWLLEACRESPVFKQFILIGGDAGMGHFFYPHKIPVTETQEHSAYPGCYPLSKVLEEVMVQQYYVQYDLNGCCLRAPWIMAGDDLKLHLSFARNAFGVPVWRDAFKAEKADEHAEKGTIPIMLDSDGLPIKRNFVHVEDLVDAILQALDHPRAKQELFNIAMDEPIDYGKLGAYLNESQNLPTLEVKTPYHSTWLDNSKAKFLLGWRPQYDLKRMVDEAWDHSYKDPGS